VLLLVGGVMALLSFGGVLNVHRHTT
jgi:hypothetical protein